MTFFEIIDSINEYSKNSQILKDIQEYRRLAKDKQKRTDNLFSPSTTKDEYAFH